VIKVNELSYTYKNGHVKAVKNISFEVKKQEIFGFLGPSGAGKSTTQSVLIKLLDGYDGYVEMFGKDLKSFGSELYESIGVGFELPNHFLKLTGKENLDFFKSLYSGKTKSVDELLTMVGLIEARDQKVEQFSKGMKVRLNFARALMNDHQILFLDEPTSGLDPVNSKMIKDIVLSEREKGKTIFITTHNMQLADDLCDRVAFMVDSEIVEMDNPETLKLKHGEKNVRLEHYEDETIHTTTFPLKDLGQNNVFLNLIKTHEIRTLHSLETTLEDVFIKVTGRRLE
jgi:fluoroquinolone transport system ATP-binding protein